MLDFALRHPSPVSIRYPKANVESVGRPEVPVKLGKAEVYRWGADGMFVAFGALFPRCVKGAERLRDEGLDVGVINARFAKPLDRDTILRAVEESGFVITVEESALMGGFGSAVLELLAHEGVSHVQVKHLGVPDHFIEHGTMDILRRLTGLSTEHIVQAARSLCETKTTTQMAFAE